MRRAQAEKRPSVTTIEGNLGRAMEDSLTEAARRMSLAAPVREASVPALLSPAKLQEMARSGSARVLRPSGSTAVPKLEQFKAMLLERIEVRCVRAVWCVL
jgi:hypothetical protein